MDSMTDGRQDKDFIFSPGASLPEKPKPGPQSGLVKTWSYSALKKFEECAYQVYLTRVEKHTEERSEAADRGTNIHTLAEEFVKGELLELPKELRHFADEFFELRDQYAAGLVSLEGEWAFTADWQPTTWFGKDAWGRMKLDAFVREDETSGRVIDYKSGKKFGNELTHSGQAQQYAIGVFMRFPELEYLETDFWYLDHASNNRLKKEYTRERAMLFLPKVNERALSLTTALEFDPKPSKHNCRFCPHKTTGNCKWAVQ